MSSLEQSVVEAIGDYLVASGVQIASDAGIVRVTRHRGRGILELEVDGVSYAAVIRVVAVQEAP